MRARRTAETAFGERTDAEWIALGVPQRRLHSYRALPMLAWTRLARAGQLRPAEVALLERISTGMGSHPRIDLGQALLLLADHEGKPRCVTPELCKPKRPHCECREGLSK